MNYNNRLFYVHVAGLFSVFAYDDISYQKIATQSHTWVGTGYMASNAVDGNITTCMRTTDIGRSNRDKNVWWKVDLGEVYNIYSISILLKNYDGYDNISYHKLATQSHTYIGTTGTNYLYEASNAVDGDTATCMRTRVIGIGSSVPDKSLWWKVDLGGVYNIYSINIQFRNYDGEVNRQRGRFAGFSLYVSNTDVSTTADIKGSTLCYKDGPQLPPLNFTTICSEKGRYVIYYNERLDEVTYPTGYEVYNLYTEICEVIVQGCNNASFYGSNCDTPCPKNCKDSTCHIQSGACFNCKPGWTGMYCTTKCGEGWYGVNCSQQCVGHCRDANTCNHVTGQCDGGCGAGWRGYSCEKECHAGAFGYDCVNNCSGHCLYNSACNKQTGHCDRGCNPGYTKSDCSKGCPPGQFGIGCREGCSGHCINNEPCDHISGVCSTGCRDGFVGSYCTNSCKEGYFGTNCSRECSPNCKPGTCKHTDGSCICASGWTGESCTTETLPRSQNMSSVNMLVVGLSVSVLINLILVVFGILLCRSFIYDQDTFWKKSKIFNKIEILSHMYSVS